MGNKAMITLLAVRDFGFSSSGSYGDYGDLAQVSYPSCRAFFFGGDQLEGSVRSRGFSVESIGDKDLPGVDGGIGFGERVEDFVPVGAFGNDAEHEERSAHLFSLRYIEFREEFSERNSGVSFVHFAVRVEHGDVGVGHGGNFRRAEGERFSLIPDGQAGGWDCGRFVMRLLRDQIEVRRPGKNSESENGERNVVASDVIFHQTILVKFPGLSSAILDGSALRERECGRDRPAAVTFH